MGASNRFSEAQKTKRSPPVEFQISAPKYLPTETGWRNTGKANAVCLRRGSPAVHLPSLCGQTTAIPFFLNSNAASIGLEATDGKEKKPMRPWLSGKASTFFWASNFPTDLGRPFVSFFEKLQVLGQETICGHHATQEKEIEEKAAAPKAAAQARSQG